MARTSSVLVVAGAEVRGSTGQHADPAAVVAVHDRVVELDRGVQRRTHLGEAVLGPRTGEPEGEAEGVGELRLSVAATGDPGVGPGGLLRHGLGVGAPAVDPVFESSSRVTEDMCTVMLLEGSDAALVEHRLERLHHGLVVPAERARANALPAASA